MARKQQGVEGITSYLLMIGLGIAVIAAIVSKLHGQVWILWSLAVFGILLGIWNITEKESTAFLVATIAVMAIASTELGTTLIIGKGGMLAALHNMIAQFLQNLCALIGPAGVVVALKEIWILGKD